VGMYKQVRTNWNRWGNQDERGTVNLLNQAHVLESFELVKMGRVYSLGAPVGKDGPVGPDRNKTWHVLNAIGNDPKPGGGGGADDILVTHCHASTHIDAFSHIWYENQLFNGHGSETVTPDGAMKCGVEKIGWIISRGLMLDIPSMLGMDRLPDTYAISVKEIEDCLTENKLKVRSGDVLLIRTGWYKSFLQGDANMDSYPGVSRELCGWLYDQDIVVLGADNVAVEIYPPEPESNGTLPVHKTMLRDLGAHLIEFLNLEELARDKVNEFLFITAPLKITGGIGSPINPLAIV